MTRQHSFQLSVGSLAGQSVTAFIRNFLPFTLLSILVLSPWIVFRFLFEPGREPGFPFLIADLILRTVLGYVLTGAVTFGVIQQLRGQPAGVATAITQGMQTFGRVLWTGILCGLRIMLFMLLLFVPGIIESIKLYVAIPAAVMEGKTGTAAVDRSLQLTDGSRWQIFGAWLVVFLLPIIIGMVALFMLQTTAVREAAVLPIWLDVLITVLTTTFGATMMAVCYFLLRSGRENVDVKELAAVFS
jgi:hypothetical protein